jgi:hypothetical protein
MALTGQSHHFKSLVKDVTPRRVSDGLAFLEAALLHFAASRSGRDNRRTNSEPTAAPFRCRAESLRGTEHPADLLKAIVASVQRIALRDLKHCGMDF